MRFIFLLALSLWASLAEASILDYLKGYKLGIEYLTNSDQVTVDYTVAGNGVDSCRNIEGTSQQRCSVVTDSNFSSGWGIFLGQPFKRQGAFYFALDLGFNLRFLKGSMSESLSIINASRGLPLNELSYELLTFTTKPYVKLGWTPKGSLPDFLFSFGPAFQMAAGEVSVNNESKNVVVLSGGDLLFGFVETEIIFLELSGGYLSLFSSKEVTGDDQGTPFFPTDKDGMSEVKARFRSSASGSFYSFGLRLLTNIP